MTEATPPRFATRAELVAWSLQRARAAGSDRRAMLAVMAELRAAVAANAHLLDAGA